MKISKKMFEDISKNPQHLLYQHVAYMWSKIEGHIYYIKARR